MDPVGVVPARDVGAGCPVSDIDMIRSRDDSQSVGQPADLLDDGGIVVVAPQDTSDPAPSAGMKAKRRAGSAPDQCTTPLVQADTLDVDEIVVVLLVVLRL